MSKMNLKEALIGSGVILGEDVVTDKGVTEKLKESETSIKELAEDLKAVKMANVLTGETYKVSDPINKIITLEGGVFEHLVAKLYPGYHTNRDFMKELGYEEKDSRVKTVINDLIYNASKINTLFKVFDIKVFAKEFIEDIKHNVIQIKSDGKICKVSKGKEVRIIPVEKLRVHEEFVIG